MKSEDEEGRLKFTKGFQQPKHAEFIYMYFQLWLPIDFAELDTGCAHLWFIVKSFLQWGFFWINPDFIRFWGAVLRLSQCFNRFSCDLRDVLSSGRADCGC